MDASPIEIDLGGWALKIAVGVIVAILSAILYDMNERLKYVERNTLTPEALKENLRAVISETTERKHR